MSESEPWSAQNLGKLQVEDYDMSESELWSAKNQQIPSRGLHVGKRALECAKNGQTPSRGLRHVGKRAFECAKPADFKQRFTTCRKASLGVSKTSRLQVEDYDMSESELWSAQNQQTPSIGLRHVGKRALECAKPADSKQRFTTCRKASLEVRKTSRLQAEVYDMSEPSLGVLELAKPEQTPSRGLRHVGKRVSECA